MKKEKTHIKWNNDNLGKVEALIIDGKLVDYVVCEKRDYSAISSNEISHLSEIKSAIKDLRNELKQNN